MNDILSGRFGLIRLRGNDGRFRAAPSAEMAVPSCLRGGVAAQIDLVASAAGANDRRLFVIWPMRPIARFDRALSVFGFDPSNYPAGEWEIPHVLGISADQFWRKIDEDADFWRTLEPYPWKDSLLALLGHLGVPWTISTSPSMNPQCAAQKVEWMRRHIDPKFTSYMIGKHKYLMARPDVLLIDDSDANVSKFSAAGGQYVLWPAHWNSRGQANDPIAAVAEEINRIVRGIE